MWLLTAFVGVGCVWTIAEVKHELRGTGTRLGVGHGTTTDATTAVAIAEVKGIVEWTGGRRVTRL